MSNLTINMTHSYKPTFLYQQVLALITLQLSVISTPPNLPSVLSFDLNKYEEAAGELSVDYLQMIRNKNQVKDNYKTIIDKGEKY